MVWDSDFFEALRRMKAPARSAATAPLPYPATEPTDPAALPPAPIKTVGLAGIALIKRFEDCAHRRADGLFEAYPDPGSGGAPWTIGWGATGAEIRPGLVWSQAQCDARLTRDLERYARDVGRAIGSAATTPNQFDALVSFHYNTGAIATATLTKLHRAGRYPDAAGEFGKWVNAGGKRLPGLVRRRAAEAALYRS